MRLKKYQNPTDMRFQKMQNIVFSILFIILFNPVNSFSGTNNNNSPVILEDEVLFTFGDETVYVSEFVYVYDKHNANDSARYSKKSVDDYLDLYINFKLKVKEAEAMGLDTVSSINKQLEQYRAQLAQSYLYDRDISDDLVKEAYNRLKKEVKVSHILISAGEDDLPEDTLKAYNKITDIANELKNGGNFTELAKKHSQDPSVKDNGGLLGYLTAFQTVYPFESAAFNTAVGKISEPVRTRFGYHLLKVHDKRDAKGKVKVSHILVKTTPEDTEEQKKAAKKKIKNLCKSIKKGATFASVAEKESDDKATAKKGGELPPFGSGRMLPEFEEVAFSLKKVGDMSKPFQTSVGWHLVKLLEKETIGAYEDVKENLRKRIERDSRSQVSKKSFLKRLRSEYQIKENPEALKTFIEKAATKDLLRSQWKAKDLTLDGTLFSLIRPGKKAKTIDYTQQQFGQFVEKNQRLARTNNLATTVNKLYGMYVEESLIKMEESRLEEKHPEFGRLMKEFRDGNLLYELMGMKVWNKAMEDTTGLKKFYEKNKANYQWGKRVKAAVLTCVNDETANEFKKQLKSNSLDITKLENELKSGGLKKAKIERANYEKDQNPFVDQVKWEKGNISKNLSDSHGSVVFVVIEDVLEPRPKELKEARGYVVADFQSELEKAWVGELRKKYPVKVNKEVLKHIYK